MSTITENLAAIELQVTETVSAGNQLQTQWEQACSKGATKEAEALETQLNDNAKALRRLVVQRESVAAAVAQEKHQAQQIHAAGLAADANSIFTGINATFDKLCSLNDQVSAQVEALDALATQWREARFLAAQAGASKLNGFADQDQSVKVGNLVASLAKSKQVVAHIAQALSRQSI